MEPKVKKNEHKNAQGIKAANKLALILAKAAEILHWFGAAAMAALLVCSVAARDRLGKILAENSGELELTSHGFNISALSPDGGVSMAAVAIFAVTAVFIMCLFAMIFRNAYLILKTADGKTRFSKGGTPFQRDVVRMLREIGIFLIAVPAVGLIASAVARGVMGVDNVELSVDLSYVVIGLLVLCLSRFFDYGTALQEDVDGLL